MAAPDVLERGLELVGEDERKRLVAGYAGRFEPLWEALCEQIGDRDVAERAFVTGAVQAAIAERRPRPRLLLEVIDRETFPESIEFEALAWALAPGHVWAADEAGFADDAAAGLEGEEWTLAVEEAGAELLEPEHEERVRVLAARLLRQLPVEGLPEASAPRAPRASRPSATAASGSRSRSRCSRTTSSSWTPRPSPLSPGRRLP